jgi:uroporphyrinogen-III synthase
MRPLLVLRPQPGATATVARARELGFHAFAIPLFEIERLAWQAPDPGRFDGLLLTSANSLAADEEMAKLRQLPVYAVGEATASAARAAGLELAAVGSAGIDHLLGSLEPNLRLLHLCGEDKRNPTVHLQPLTRIAVYRAKAVPLPDLALAAGAVALIHSPRAGRRFAELVQDRGSVRIAAISPAAAQAVNAGWEAVEASPEPTDDALLALAARLCNKPRLE